MLGRRRRAKAEIAHAFVRCRRQRSVVTARAGFDRGVDGDGGAEIAHALESKATSPRVVKGARATVGRAAIGDCSRSSLGVRLKVNGAGDCSRRRGFWTSSATSRAAEIAHAVVDVAFCSCRPGGDRSLLTIVRSADRPWVDGAGDCSRRRD